MKTIFAFIGVAAVVSSSIKAAATAFIKNVVYSFGKIVPNWSKLDQGVIVLKMPVFVTNNNSFPIYFDSFEATAFLGERLTDPQGNVLPNGGLKISDVLVYNPTPIGAGESAALIVEFEIKAIQTLMQAITAVQAGLPPITTTIWLYGWVNVLGNDITGAISIPVAIPLNLLDM